MKLYKKNGYDYLLNIPFKQMTKKNMAILKEKIKILENGLIKIKKMSVKQLWINDLKKI